MRVRGIRVSSLGDADVVERVLSVKRAADEQEAVAKWLAEGNRPTVADRGQSGIYDEYGLPRRGSNREIGPRTAERVRIANAMRRMGIDDKSIAGSLGISLNNYRSLMNRWGTGA